MRKLNKNQLEPFEDLFVEFENEDIELIEAFTLDQDTTDELDTINQFVFRKFNDKITNEEIKDIVDKYEDPEFASFSINYFEDVIIVYAYI